MNLIFEMFSLDNLRVIAYNVISAATILSSMFEIRHIRIIVLYCFVELFADKLNKMLLYC